MERPVWRKVDGLAIECTNCVQNAVMVGGPDICRAPDEVCVFMKKKIYSQKTWDDFHKLYHDQEEEEE